MRLESIKERVSKIGGTPWKATDYSSDYYNQGYAVQSWNGAAVAKCIEEAGEVDFIANAPTDIAFLLQRLEIAQKALVDVSSEVWKENVPTSLAVKVRRIVEEAFKE